MPKFDFKHHLKHWYLCCSWAGIMSSIISHYSRLLWTCRASTISDLPINLWLSRKRVSPLIYTLCAHNLWINSETPICRFCHRPPEECHLWWVGVRSVRGAGGVKEYVAPGKAFSPIKPTPLPAYRRQVQVQVRDAEHQALLWRVPILESRGLSSGSSPRQGAQKIQIGSVGWQLLSTKCDPWTFSFWDHPWCNKKMTWLKRWQNMWECFPQVPFENVTSMNLQALRESGKATLGQVMIISLLCWWLCHYDEYNEYDVN